MGAAAHPDRFAGVDERVGVDPEVVGVHLDDVGVGLRHPEAVDPPEAGGEPRGVVVVGLEPGDVLQGAQPRRRHQPRLPHPAAEQLPDPAGGVDELGVAREDRPHRRPQALREAEQHRVDVANHPRGVDVEGDTRVEQPRTVEVDRDADPVGGVGGCRDPVGGDGDPAAGVVGVLDRHQPGSGAVQRLRDVGVADLFGGRHRGGPGVDGPGLDRRELRQSGEFPPVDVGLAVEDHLLAAVGMDPRRDLVAHRARGDVHRRVHPDPVGRGGFEFVHCRIVAVDIVADRRVGGRRPHPVGGPRHRVAPEVESHTARFAAGRI
mgnify:CR=1 FL=1